MNALWSVLGAKVGRPNEETENLGKHVFNNLIRALKDTEIIEGIEIVHADSLTVENSFLKKDGYIGINLLVVPLLFHYAYKQFTRGSTTDDITKCLVLCCPDYVTVWNNRKVDLVNGSNESLTKEMDLTTLVLRLHHKSSETYAHRRWIFKRMYKKHFQWLPRNSRLQGNTMVITILTKFYNVFYEDEKIPIHTESPTDLFTPSKLESSIEQVLCMSHEEISLCCEISIKKISNYNGWAHKAWVLSFLKCLGEKSVQVRGELSTAENDDDHTKWMSSLSKVMELIKNFLKNNVHVMMKLAERNISDCSVINSLLHSLNTFTDSSLVICSNTENRNDLMTLWTEVLSQNSRLLKLYGSHESLWYCRKMLFLSHLKYFCSNRNDDFTLESEISFCQNCVLKVDLLKPISVDFYAERHISFLKKFVF